MSLIVSIISFIGALWTVCIVVKNDRRMREIIEANKRLFERIRDESHE